MSNLARENGKLKHRVFRVSQNEIRLNVIATHGFFEECLAIYHRRNHKDEWKVSFFDSSPITMEVLEMIHSYMPAKGRHYQPQEKVRALGAFTSAAA